MAAKKFIKRALFGGAIGAFTASFTAQAGLRGDSAREGAIQGALLGSLTPLVAGRAARSLRAKKNVVMKGIKPRTRKNVKIVFRRIRGRIVPVKVKG